MIQTLPPLPLCPVLSLSAHAAAPGKKKKKERKKKESSGDNRSSPTSHLPPATNIKTTEESRRGPSALRRFVLLAERTRRPLGTCSSPRGRHTISAKTSTPAPSWATCHAAPRNCHQELARWCRLRSKLQGWGREPRLSKHLDALHFKLLPFK